MIQVTFYTFSKKENSTKRPGSSGVSFDCEIKRPCSIMSPVIEINGYQQTAPDFNYCYISDFKRFYWVSNWTWERGLWIATLRIDVLASWKTNIGASSQYVIRSSAAYDGYVMDSLYPAKAISTITRVTDASPAPWSDASETAFLSGSFVLGVVSSASAAETYGSSAAIDYYVLPYTQMRALMNYMLSNPDWMNINITEMSINLQKAFINPFEYIVSCLWFPFGPGIMANTSVTRALKLGWWTIPGITAYPFKSQSQTVDRTFTITIPKHPQAASRGVYCNVAPYAKYTLTVGPFGSFALDSVQLQDSSQLTCIVKVDLVTGLASLILANVVGAYYPGIHYAMFGVPVQLAQINTNISGVASSVLGGVANIAMGNYMGLAGNVLSAINSGMPQANMTGGTGSVINFASDITLIGEFFELADDDVADKGRPLCQIRQLSTIPGYIKIEDPKIEAPATAQELSAIEGYMSGGFFYE